MFNSYNLFAFLSCSMHQSNISKQYPFPSFAHLANLRPWKGLPLPQPRYGPGSLLFICYLNDMLESALVNLMKYKTNHAFMQMI